MYLGVLRNFWELISSKIMKMKKYPKNDSTMSVCVWRGGGGQYANSDSGDRFHLHINIGIKHVFLCINICWTPRVVLRPEPERF